MMHGKSRYSETSLMSDSDGASETATLLSKSQLRLHDGLRSYQTSDTTSHVYGNARGNGYVDHVTMDRHPSRENLYTQDGQLYRRALSVGDSIERITLSWNNVHVHAKLDREKKFCCGRGERQFKHILKGGEFY